jgi:hypothetical protein
VPDEVNPGYVACSSCHRVVETGHVNSSGRCILCAGKTAAQLAAEEPAGHRMSEDGSVLVEPESEKSAEEQREP